MQGGIYPIALLVAATLSACATTPRADRASEEQRIRELEQQWAQAAGRRDLDAALAFYAPDAYFLVPNAPPARGTEQIRQHWQGMFALPNVSLSFQPTQIVVSEDGNMAHDYGSYTLAYDGSNGRITDQGKYSVVWRKINGEWKVVSDMISSNLPVPAPAPVEAPQPIVFDMSTDPEMHAAKGLKWNPITPEGFKPGMKLAVVHGDPGSTSDYVIRLSFPDGYEFPPHYHPNAEHVTVLQGTFLLAMGEKFDRSKLQTYAPGDLIYAPAKKPHYGGARGETVIQLHGIGPFDILLVK